MKCDWCKKKIEFTYFKHVTGKINFCYDCGLELFDIKGQKFYKNHKFVKEFVLSFEDTEDYWKLKKQSQAKKEFLWIVQDIAKLQKEFLLPTDLQWKIPPTKFQWRPKRIKKQ